MERLDGGIGELPGGNGNDHVQHFSGSGGHPGQYRRNGGGKLRMFIQNIQQPSAAQVRGNGLRFGQQVREAPGREIFGNERQIRGKPHVSQAHQGVQRRSHGCLSGAGRGADDIRQSGNSGKPLLRLGRGQRINKESGLPADIRRLIRHGKRQQGPPSVPFALPDKSCQLQSAFAAGVRSAAGLEHVVNDDAFFFSSRFIAGDQPVGDHGQRPLIRTDLPPAGGIRDEGGKPLDFRQRAGLILKKAHARMIAGGGNLPRKNSGLLTGLRSFPVNAVEACY